GVRADAALLAQAGEQRAAHEVAARLAAAPEGQAARASARAAVLRGGAPLLEVAELVGLAEDARPARGALGVALVLEDLAERLDPAALARRGGLRRGPVGARVLDREHAPVREVRVVRDRERVAAAAGVEALRAQAPPQLLGRARL